MEGFHIVTESEKRLSELLVSASDPAYSGEKDLAVGIILAARRDKRTDDIISFIEKNNVKDLQKIAAYVWPAE